MCEKCGCTGAVSSKGSKGDKGDTGATGATGAAGANGTTILYNYSNATGVSTPASTVETSLASYNVPSNTLSSDGDQLDVYIYVSTVKSVTEPVTFRIKFGGLTIATFTVDGTGDNIFRLKIDRTGAGAQFWTLDRITDISAVAAATITSYSSAADETVANIIQITGQCATDGTASATLKKFVVERHKI